MLDCSSSKSCHGILLIITGCILLLNTLGVLKETTSIAISIASVAMLVYGFFLCDGPQRIKDLFKKDTPSIK